MAILKIRDENGNVTTVPAIKGKSAYEYAKDGGYTGTEEEFSQLLATVDNLSSGGSGLDTTTIALLINVLKNAVYINDQKANITNLENLLLKNGASSGDTYYSIIQNLDNVSSDNLVLSVIKDSYFTTTLTASNGYTLASVIVTMDGADITETCYSDGVITITNVTGNVVITATAESNSEYVFYDYIEGDGTANSIIYTDIMPNVQHKMELSFDFDSTIALGTGPKAIIGTRGSDTGNAYKYLALFITPSTNKLGYWIDDVDSVTEITNLVADSKNTIKITPDVKNGKATITVNDTEYDSALTSFSGRTPRRPLCLFCYNYDNPAPTHKNVRLGEISSTDADGNAVYDLKPALQKTTGSYGFYEAVNGVFYTNEYGVVKGGNW